MPDQKIDNLLNLAMDATPQERRKSGNLNIGYDPASIFSREGSARSSTDHSELEK